MNLPLFIRVLVGAVGLSLAPSLAHAKKAPPPNLLIIQTDEHNFRTLGAYRDLLPEDQAFVWGPGNAVETPNIDWLAREGLIADRAYATTPVCTPSRAALVTGLYPQNTGSIRNDWPLKDEMITFAHVLGEAGYATGYAGKWHLDGDGKPQWGPERKFGFADNRYMFNRGHWKKLGEDDHGPHVAAKDKQGEPSYGAEGADEKSFTTDYLTDRTIDFIRENSDNPFAYMVAIPDPHGPHSVRAPYDTMFADLDIQQPMSGQHSGHNLPSYAATEDNAFRSDWLKIYFGMVKCIDDNVGRVLNVLREEGILDNTIIVFTSDHGDLCGEHGRYNKGVPMEGSARIPFIMRAPGIIDAGTVIHQPFGTVDFKPTILSLLGVEDTSINQGRDFASVFRTGQTPDGLEEIAFVRNGGSTVDDAGNYMPDNGWIGAFGTRFKLVFASSEPGALFDLYEDPHELTNLIDSPLHRHIVRDLANALKHYAESNQEPHLDSPQIQADFAWALSERVPYIN